MAATDDELDQLEKGIRTLKIEYEQYFGGGRKRPPSDTQWRVELILKRANERLAEMSFAQRFRFNNLTQTFAKYQDMWRKKVMEKEGAFVPHHFGAAAKAIEAARAQKQERQSRLTPRGGPTSPPAEAFTMAISDPDAENEKVQRLYEILVKARQQAGEHSSAPSLADFQQFVRHKTAELREQGGKSVEYTVTVEEGRVKLKARTGT